jgi:hypothetical protein
MEEFDEAEEQNEEDLLELGDTFGNINLKVINKKIYQIIELCSRHFKRIYSKR